MKIKMGLFRLFYCKSFLIFAASVIVSTSIGLFLTTVIMSNYLTYQCESSSSFSSPSSSSSSSIHLEHRYDRNSSLIFVGGWPRSGTTLMRAMLDAHPQVRCGEETHIIPRFLAFIELHQSPGSSRRLDEAGVTASVLVSASAAFLLEIIAGHGAPAPRLCNKDPYTASYADQLGVIFPAARFVLMLRDGRAVCHSSASLGLVLAPGNSTNMAACLKTWSDDVDYMHSACVRLGSGRCRAVKYEQLVLHPRSVLRGLLEFLEVPWADEVLRHHELINKPGGISVSRLEPSSHQIIKPVNPESLTKWAEFVPDEVRRNIRLIAPTLEKLGYDPDAYPPDYGQPDEEVAENVRLIKDNEKLFEQLALEVRNQSKIKPQEQRAKRNRRESRFHAIGGLLDDPPHAIQAV